MYLRLKQGPRSHGVIGANAHTSFDHVTPKQEYANTFKKTLMLNETAICTLIPEIIYNCHHHRSVLKLAHTTFEYFPDYPEIR